MNAALLPYINTCVNQYLNALFDAFTKEILPIDPALRPDGATLALRDLINKERYPVKIHIKESLVKNKPEAPRPNVARGRKKTHPVKVTDLDLDKYIQVVVLTVNNEKYFIDQYNILYKYQNSNEIVGHVVNQEIQWF
jgi:hypothetical protein